MVMFMALILLLILTILGVSLARMQTVEERLAQNDNNHAMALQTAEAALQAAFDDDVDGIYTDFSGATSPALVTLSGELGVAPFTSIGYTSTTWANPGVSSLLYNGTPLAAAPAAAQPQFVIEAMAPDAPPGCQSGNAGNYGSGSPIYVHRITAHSAGGDGTASATVQTTHIGGC
jgi:Tfp pilus assembly protein PilX